jgi:hypothetical protein
LRFADEVDREKREHAAYLEDLREIPGDAEGDEEPRVPGLFKGSGKKKKTKAKRGG